MASSFRRTIPRVFSPIQRISLSKRQPLCLFHSHNTTSGSLGPGNISNIEFISPPSRARLRNFSTESPISAESPENIHSILPVCCPGCGAYAQTTEPNEPGYYNTARKSTRALMSESRDADFEEQLRQEALSTINDVIEETGAAPQPDHDVLVENATDTVTEYLEMSKRPVKICDRCHNLRHHNEGVSVVSPTTDSIRAYLEESPHKDNRIYHLIDAADFPMSLVDGVYEKLSLQEPPSRNRRATMEKYRHGRKLPTISFVITRSDLLGPTKELVDSKMDYVRSVLREKLRFPAEQFRMGNVHMISANRGWWTQKVKEEMREHGGGLWIMGKANVGKSRFVEACLPKDSKNLEKMAELVERRQRESSNFFEEPALSSDSLLPPAPEEDLYPVLPIVSWLPGTTVSPIRIPFGRGRGEVIDLPGLDRPGLSNHVLDEHKRDLIMTKRIKPERHVIKSGQSLLLGGGLVRITAVDPNIILQAACFVPIEAHATKTEKAVEMQAQERKYPKTNIIKDGTGKLISSAGTFDLKWDVTESNLPGSIAKALNDKRIRRAPRLPYRVMSADILLEGCGWIELTAQIRTRSIHYGDQSANSFPQVEVFTPEGNYIASRRPMESWQFIAAKRKADRRAAGPRGRQNIGRKKRILGSQAKS